MKKFLFPLLAACAFTIGSAAAQTTPAATTDQGPGRREQRSPEEMAKNQSQRMSKELGLTSDQTNKVQQILMARSQEMQADRTQAKDAANHDQLREQMQASRAKYDGQFKAVLTPEQYTKYTTMRADRMKHGFGPSGVQDGKIKAKNGKVKIKKSDS